MFRSKQNAHSSCGIASNLEYFIYWTKLYIIDSSATYHMFSNKQLLTNLNVTKNINMSW